jgi:hypothetical protein
MEVETLKSGIWKKNKRCSHCNAPTGDLGSLSWTRIQIPPSLAESSFTIPEDELCDHILQERKFV